jgi:hypothetical protein
MLWNKPEDNRDGKFDRPIIGSPSVEWVYLVSITRSEIR